MSCRHCSFEDGLCALFLDEDSIEDLGLSCDESGRCLGETSLELLDECECYEQGESIVEDE